MTRGALVIVGFAPMYTVLEGFAGLRKPLAEGRFERLPTVSPEQFDEAVCAKRTSRLSHFA